MNCNELITESHKPCPFCGSKNILISTREHYYSLYYDNGSATIAIHCPKCSLDLYEHDIVEFNYEQKRKTLIKKWNTRYNVRTKIKNIRQCRH